MKERNSKVDLLRGIAIAMVVLNYLITMAITAFIAYLMNQNKWINSICFGR